MAKQTINIGTGELTGDGESLRSAWDKVNDNFDEVYSDIASLDGNKIVYSDLSVVTASASGGGSLTYNNSTGTFTFTPPAAGFDGDYNSLSNRPTIPADVSDLTDTEGLLSVAPSLGDWTFDDNILSQGGTDHAVIQASDFAGAKLILKTRGPTAKEWEFDQDGDLTLPAGGDILDSTGSSVLGGDTGDITFSGVKIIGAGTASGDGNGYSTLELVPDNDLYDNDQYLVIDPTSPTHIHIRGGGTQDSSNAELFLGGEANYVRVADSGGVRLQNQTRNDTTYNYGDPATFNTGSWYESAGTYFVQYTTADVELVNVTFQFNDDSENTLSVTYNGGANTSLLTSAGSVSNLGSGVYRVTVNEAPPASPTAITGLEYTIWFTRDNSLQLQSNDFTVSVTDDIRITGNDTFSLRNTSTTEPITINTDYDGSAYAWEFGADGTLQAPGDIEVTGDITGTSTNSTLVLSAEPGSNTYIQLNDSVDSTINTFANLEIITNVSNTPKTWTFDTSGDLSVPNYIQFKDSSFIGDEGGAGTPVFRIDAAAGLGISLTSDSGIENANHNWLFGADGHLVVPGDITFRNGGYIQDTEVFFVATPGTFSIQTDKNGIQKDWTFGTDGSLQIPGDIVSENAINIDINLSDSTLRRWRFGEDGNTEFPGEITATNGNFTTAVTARNINADGGNISLNPDFGLIFTQSNAVITADTASWTLGTDGVLTLPGGGNIEADASITLKAYYGPPGSNHAWQFDGATGTVRKTTSGYMDIGGLSGVKLTATGETTKIWTFDGDGNLAAPGNITSNILKINDGVHETLALTAGIGSGVNDLDCSLGHITYNYSVSANWTVNLTNLNLDEQRATTITIVIDQEGTGYYPNALQIAGTPYTINWQGNTLPTPSSNRVDVVTFSILRTGVEGAEYTVLGQLTGF